MPWTASLAWVLATLAAAGALADPGENRNDAEAIFGAAAALALSRRRCSRWRRRRRALQTC